MPDLVQEQYNKFSFLPQVSYNLIDYLLNNNDLIWKLLKYNDADAWRTDSTHPNLTNSEKGALIYDGLKNQIDCRVFLDYGQDESMQDQICLLRTSVVDAIPSNYIWGHLTFGWEVFSHFKINTLSNYQTRTHMIGQQLIETFNGKDLGNGIGRIYFDSSRNSRSRMTIIGNAPFKGVALFMCNYAL
jgi:hypothetical protein